MKWLPRILGLLILIGVILGVWLWQSAQDKAPDGSPVVGASRKGAVTVSILVGGEKISLLKDPDVVQLLSENHGITVAAEKAGSLEMVRQPVPGKDAFWPSNQVALDLYKNLGGKSLTVENVFGSPVVIYGYTDVVAALITAGVVREEAGIAWCDMARLTQLLIEEKQWKDIGLPQFFGKVRVVSTNPVTSSSGNMFAALLASMINKGEVPDTSSIDQVIPPLQKYYTRLGLLEESSGNLFEKFLNDKGGHPLVVGYENQLVEFTLDNPRYQEILRSSVRSIYPQPTAWAEHPLIATTPNGQRLITALKDPEIQRIAWEKHGFRTGLNAQNDPQKLQIVGIPANVTAVIPMPSSTVTDRIIAGLTAR